MEDSKELNNNNEQRLKDDERSMSIDPDNIDRDTQHLSESEVAIIKKAKDMIRSVSDEDTQILIIAQDPDWEGVICMGTTMPQSRMGRLAEAIKRTIKQLF